MKRFFLLTMLTSFAQANASDILEDAAPQNEKAPSVSVQSSNEIEDVPATKEKAAHASISVSEAPEDVCASEIEVIPDYVSPAVSFVKAYNPTDMPVIHRGFVKQRKNKYTFHVMAQGPKKMKCYGIASLLDPLGTFEQIKIFPMRKGDKRIGRTFFSDLMPGTTYNLRIGYAYGSKPPHIDGWDHILSTKNMSVAWGVIPMRSIKTPPKKPNQTCSFVFGSCNRFAHVAGKTFMLDKGSRMFQTMADDISNHDAHARPTDAIVTLGDWVYNDPLAFGIGEQKTFKHIAHLYQLTNTTPGAKALFGTDVPFYQVWDDHERYNDVTGEVPAHKQAQANAGRRAYDLYQRPQGPSTPHNWFKIPGSIDGFVMDLRSELLPSLNLSISYEQMKALKSYLKDPVRKNQLKPVFMSTTALCLQGDGWSASPDQLNSLMGYIKTKRIKGVIFLTGDIHVGVSGLWEYNGEKKAPYVLEVASSAFHKISHNKDALLKPTADIKGLMMSAKGGLSHVTTEDHFTRIVLDHTNLTVEVIRKDRHNVVLEDILYNLNDGSFQDVNEAHPLYKRFDR